PCVSSPVPLPESPPLFPPSGGLRFFRISVSDHAGATRGRIALTAALDVTAEADHGGVGSGHRLGGEDRTRLLQPELRGTGSGEIDRADAAAPRRVAPAFASDGAKAPQSRRLAGAEIGAEIIVIFAAEDDRREPLATGEAVVGGMG